MKPNDHKIIDVLSMERLAAVILAAGLSSRMGRCKPLMPLAGTTALARLIKLYREAHIPRIIVVTGHRGEAVTAEAQRYGAITVHNRKYRQGMFSSVCTGIRALETDINGFFIHPTDIPLVRPWSIKRVKSQFKKHRPAIVYPVFVGTRGHPPLISADLITAILRHDGSSGLRGALLPFESQAREAATFDSHILLDMDSPEDYRYLLKRSTQLGIPDGREADALLAALHLSPDGVIHARTVAQVAREIAGELQHYRPELNPDLVYAAALLHDIAKGDPGHGAQGGRILREMGLPEVAAIVAAHQDVTPPADRNISEKEIVYMADKLVRGGNRVSLEQRYQEKLDAYAHDPEASAAILKRRDNARAMRSLLIGLSHNLARIM